MLDAMVEQVPVALLVVTKGHELASTDREELAALAETYGTRLYIVILGERERETMESFRIRWTPTFLLVDATGRLAAVWEGSSENLLIELEELLGESKE